MSAVIMMNGQRMDLTCRMKDADEILKIFGINGIDFGKKYTSIHGGAESTITFVGLRAKTSRDKITDALMALNMMARNDVIGNIYVQSWAKKRKKFEKKDTAVSTDEIEDDTE